MISTDNVLITGCSTGIGRSTALYLDRLGYRVFASVRKQSDADALKAEGSERLTPIPLDVTEPESICRAEAEVRRAVGDRGLLGLVNNAGIAFHAPLESAPLDAFRQLFDVNVFGLLEVTQKFLPLLRCRRGRIVSISSQSVLAHAPFHGPYTASKAAIEALSNSLRLELKPLGVQVTTIVAGSIDTPIWNRAGQWSDETKRRQPSEASALYSERLETFRRFMAAMGRRGIDPETVSRVVARALTAKRMKHSYWVAVDLNVRLFYTLRDVMPEPLQEWILLQAIGLAQR